MTPLLVAGAIVAGALVGAGSGWLVTALERVEKLEAEEAEERVQYERDVATARERAAAGGETPPEAEPWAAERYGWTWLERYLGPGLGAAGFGAFTAHEAFDTGLLVHLLWVAVFVHIVTFDLKHRLILNKVTYPAILAALALAQVSPGLTIVRALIGGGGVAAFFLLQNLVSRGSIGLGDAKLGALVGAVTGAALDGSHLGAVIRGGVRGLPRRRGGAHPSRHPDPATQGSDSVWSVSLRRSGVHPLPGPMSTNSQLMPDERAITMSRQHWSVVVPWIVAGILVLIAGIVVLVLVPATVGGHSTKTPRLIAGIVLVVAVILWTGLHYLRWRLLTYLLTDRRIMVESGVLSRTTESITLDRIQNTVIKRPLGDRMIGAGDIEISSAGRDGVEVLHRIPNAQAFYTAIMQAVEGFRSGSYPPPHPL